MNTKSLFIAILLLVFIILPPNWHIWTGQTMAYPFALHLIWLVVLMATPWLMKTVRDGD